MSCNINSVVSCGTVGSSWQAHLFGFPNAFLGLVAEPVVITHVNVRDGNLFLPRRVQVALTGGIDADLDVMAVTIWILVVVLAVVLKYGWTLFGWRHFTVGVPMFGITGADVPGKRDLRP
ncbi:vitamin K epoxide reductase family protein [Nonomuraea sp. B19D2]|uniref:vitamin K epoxide reductase family protein n=1 Tax=Nonomuraea sp. B19D2 TaxID=3159561 RepID=UPI0032DB83FE